MKPIIVVVGPTAVGKSEMAIRIAQKIGAEIISGDAFQFYKRLDIGTAKLSVDEWRGIPHHLIDILSPNDEFSVADYQKVVRAKIDELRTKNITPILVGGSGLYIQSVIYDYRFTGSKREEDSDLAKMANGELWNLLHNIAPEVARVTDISNRRRLLRALELASEKTEEDEPNSYGKNLFYPEVQIIGLEMPRDILYASIDARVDKMMQLGLEAEVKKLHDEGIRSQATMAIGYKELYAYFDGLTTLETAVSLIKQQTRRYAKRQLTWFKNQMQAKWYLVNTLDFESTVLQVLNDLE